MNDTKLLSNFIKNNLKNKQPPLHILLSIQTMLEEGMLEVKIVPRRLPYEKKKKKRKSSLVTSKCSGYSE